MASACGQPAGRRSAAGLVVGLLALGIPLVAPAIVAAAARTIDLVAYTTTVDVNAGVSSKSKLTLETPAHAKAGTASFSCVFPTPGTGTERCTDTYRLKGGTIVVRFTVNADTQGVVGTHAVSSGTGAFSGARGTVTTRDLNSYDAITINLR